MSRAVVLASLVASSTLLAPRAARADGPPPHAHFGDTGQVVFSSESSLAFTSTTYSNGSGAFSSFTLDLGADYFVAPRLSVGAELTYEKLSGNPAVPIAKRYGGGVRAGYAVPLSDRLTLWPRVGLQYAVLTEDAGDTSGGGVVGGGIPVNAAAGDQWIVTASSPVVYTPAPHFFLGFGPTLAVPVATSENDGDDSYPRLWSLGLALTIGGTLGGAPEPAPEPEPDVDTPDTRAPTRHFGDQGTLALTSALALSVGYTGSNDGSSDATFQVSPAFDYFAWKGISVGLIPSFAKGPPADTLPTALAESIYTWGLGARVGGNVPLGDSVSIWPHVALGASMSNAAGLSFSPQTTPWLAFDAPVLVHVAPHLFAGFGPTLYRELGKIGGPDLEEGLTVAATTVGCSLVVGGWL